MIGAIEQSCDVYFYQLGQKVGLERWSEHAAGCGFGQPTGFDLSGEVAGIVPKRSYYDHLYGEGKWSRGLMLNLAIGQGEFSVTPVQLAVYFAALANGGVAMRPRLLQARRQPGQPVVRWMDGPPSLWDAAEACLESPSHADLLGRIPVAGSVRRAAKLFGPSQDDRETFSRARLLRILRGEAVSVIRGLRRRASTRRLKGEAHKEIQTLCGSFHHHVTRLRYQASFKAGYPIAGGVIAGACRPLLQHRRQRTGIRCRVGNAQQMLNLRAVFPSSSLPVFLWGRLPQHPHRK